MIKGYRDRKKIKIPKGKETRVRKRKSSMKEAQMQYIFNQMTRYVKGLIYLTKCSDLICSSGVTGSLQEI